MAQTSLSRLHKLDTGLCWESAYLNKTESWQSLKLYNFLFYFCLIFTSHYISFYKYCWLNSAIATFTPVNFSITHFIYKKAWTQLNNSLVSYKKPATTTSFLQLYLIYLKNSYYALIVLLPKVQYYKKKKWLKKKRSLVAKVNPVLYPTSLLTQCTVEEQVYTTFLVG